MVARRAVRHVYPLGALSHPGQSVERGTDPGRLGVDHEPGRYPLTLSVNHVVMGQGGGFVLRNLKLNPTKE